MHGLRRHPSRCHCKGPETQRKLKQGLGKRSPLKSNWLDTVQDSLVIGGNIPVIGNVLDAVNTGVSLGRSGYAAYQGDTDEAKKHLIEAGKNAVSMVPGTQTLTSVRTANKIRKGVKNIKKTSELVEKANNELKDQNKNIPNKKPGITTIDNKAKKTSNIT